MKKTLGGDRLGAGKKMTVDLHGYERSTHDLSYLWRSTMSAGPLVPFMSQIGLPGDTFDIDLDADIKTHPTIGPLFGSYKVQLDVFEAPMRLYNRQLHNNALGIGLNMAGVKFPIVRLRALDVPATIPEDLDNMTINPSCLLNYLGIRGVGYNNTGTPRDRDFNAMPLLAYWDIYKNYYANKQEEDNGAPMGALINTPTLPLTNTITGMFIGAETIPIDPLQGTAYFEQGITTNILTINYTPDPPILSQVEILTDGWGWISLQQIIDNGGTLADSGTTLEITWPFAFYGNNFVYSYRYVATPTNVRPEVTIFNLSQIDTMRELILSASTATPFNINTLTELPYSAVWETPASGIPLMLNSQQGLGLKTYQSDLFNNWLNTEWIDGTNGISEVTAIDTTGGSFTLDTLNLSKKIYDMLNRIAVSGGTYKDWLEVNYQHTSYWQVESPIYHGGLSKELIFQEVVSNAEAGSGESGPQPLGTLAGKGIMAKKHKGGKITIKVNEPSYIIGIISLTPRVDYSQGNQWDTYALKTMDDLHKPALDEIGFQELITEQMAYWSTYHDGTGWVQQSAGKQPAWINYMTNVNKCAGNFAISSNEMFMTLNRRYEFLEEGTKIKDLTTYIDPVKYNNIFASTAIDAQNFWAQIAVDITARRKMSGKIMPNL